MCPNTDWRLHDPYTQSIVILEDDRLVRDGWLGGEIVRMSGLRAARAMTAVSEHYDARLARAILEGGSSASAAAMMLLEYRDPSTLDAAVALVADQGTVTEDAFDCVADAWETYRHLKHLCWD